MFSDEEINRHNYQFRFQEMESKIRKCELERTQLEQRFTQLMRERQECEKAAERSMKLKYKRMMELERQRAERNESLLRMLHKIDQQAASLAAKTDRLKMLKTQYESYLIRSWSSQRALPPSPAPSICSHQIFPPAPPQPSYYRNTESPKSDFVRYLSDLTHTQTAIHNPIPPPTVLSNYIASQPSSSSTWSRDPFSRTASDVILQPTFSFPASSLNPPIPETPRHRPPSTKPQLSNEEFIQYIDNEILKAPDIPTVETPPPPMVALPNIRVDPPTITPSPLPAAYLEDVTNEEEVKPLTEYDEDKAYVIEDLAEKLALYDQAEEQPKLEDTEITQRWERIVEVNSTKPEKEPSVQETKQSSIEEVDEIPAAQVASESVKAELKLEEPYKETIQEVYQETHNSSASEEVQQEPSVSYEQPELSTAPEEVQPEYQQSYASEADYQQYPTAVEQEYQAPVDYNYQYAPEQPVPTEADTNQPPIQQEDPAYWTTARQAVKAKTITALGQSRTPETIEEVANNGEAVEPIERRSTPSGSKRSSPMGEIVSPSEIHQSQPEEQPAVDTTQYNYSQYPQEYDPAAEQQAYQQYPQDGSDQQYYEYQEQDPAQAQQQYQEYAEGTNADPNQYQQATEYPGPTQYVFEQGYYDQPQPVDPNQQQAYYDQSQQPQTTEDQQQYDPNQQAYYDPNAEQQQQYYEEAPAPDQTVYDQSQEYGAYETSQSEGQQAVVAVEPEAVEPKEPETESISKVEEETPAVGTEEASSPSLLFATSEESEQQVKVVEEQQEQKNVEESRGGEDGKDTTTVSSVNDESDFDFSTQ
ncbi:RNA polymerase II degradation factor 1 [Culex quinquefasciatus]|uniref:RNA polymerase II degradation factor 1 n=1 Tax=Culex quinquefasciatus TaxID=7176 RepID=UPI0018E340FC|nr:RNA polymerase II degradation factor 1 [Culex quinquefasciatus]XP_038105245.1 RNA polymerase II degradation factor 1 [Culex quinquefasciatus]XP_038105246.1 RNA polymerase II degradation factor 1 [Culex quinquefasciatus]